MSVRVTNIQRFSLQDGPGIRTTVFLKGCNLKCPWCANPENIDYEKTEYIDGKTNERRIFGYDITIDELYDEIMKDKVYFELNNGGVTFSGGEPLIQVKQLEPLFQKLKKENINICIETALQVSNELVEIATKYIDECIIDIKILDKEECKNVLNGNIDLYIKNLKTITKKIKDITFRIPLINEYTLKTENINKMLDLLKQFKVQKVEIFKIHNLAESKYKAIGKQIKTFEEVKDIDVENLYNKIRNLHINTEIIKI